VSGAAAKNDIKGGGLGRTMGAYIDSSLNWKDIAWLRRATKLPIVLKGIQTAADAKLAMEHGIEGIILSNHGGRSLDTWVSQKLQMPSCANPNSSPPAILALLEIRRHCPEVLSRVEVYVDGGIRRGTDILKCLCLGAKAVGMGRHFLYALNYGQEGIEHFISGKSTPNNIAMKVSDNDIQS
jgi:L-lactate dehydrogenase (cytochrome)